jgi:hypothetical protein
VAPSKWLVNVSLADSSREIPLPLSKINADRMGAVHMTPVQKTMMGKDVMGQFDERQTGEREVRQVLRGNLLRASDKYGKEGNVVNATMSTGGVRAHAVAAHEAMTCNSNYRSRRSPCPPLATSGNSWR